MTKRAQSLKLLKSMMILFLSMGTVGLTIGVLNANRSMAQSPAEKQPQSNESSGFVWYFDATLQQFETITLPVVTNSTRQPHSVVITGNTIWYTDPGADRIGRLTYTNTNDYHFEEFNLPAASSPYDIAVNNDEVWFTASEGDWIGRLEISSSAITTFATTTNSRPWSIEIDAVGDVWFLEKQANKLGYLTLNGPNPPTMMECDIPQANSQPEDLTLNQNNMFLSVTAPAGQKRLFRAEWTPSMISSCADITIQFFTLIGDPEPFKLVVQGLNLWFTEPNENQVDNFVQGTFPRPIPYDVPTAGSQPYDIVLDTNGNAWFSERIGANLGKVDITGQTVQILEYPVPAIERPIWLQGIDIDPAGSIWLAGFSPTPTYLPIVLK